MSKRSVRLATAFLLASIGPAWCAAAVVDVSATATVSIRVAGGGNAVTDTQAFPGDPLPLQPVVAVRSDQAGVRAAGVGAAQFADPNSLPLQANPEEFAVNISLDSVSPSISYEGSARVVETREITFEPVDLGAAAGASRTVQGQVFLDGALAVFATTRERSLSGAGATISITVEQRSPSQGDQTLVAGSIALAGADGGVASATTSGALRNALAFSADLGGQIDALPVLNVLILLPTTIRYNYTAVVGEPFTLVATLDVQLNNAPDGVGVAAIVGTPVTSLQEVIEATRGSDAAAKFLALLQREREDPSGQAVNAPRAAAPLLGLCGLFGVETALLALATGGACAARGVRRRLV